MVLDALQHSVLTKLPICGLQSEPIAFVPGTAFVLTHQTPWDSRLSVSTDHLSRFDVLECDRNYILEALLLSKAFESPRDASSKLQTVWWLVASASSLSVRLQQSWTLAALKMIIASVAAKVARSAEELERGSLQLVLLREELLAYFATYASPSTSEQEALERIVRDAFQNSSHCNEWFVKQWRRREAEAAKAPGDGMTSFLVAAAKALHLVPRRALLIQAQTLASGLLSATGVVLAGSCGTGKTTAYTLLAKALDLYQQDSSASAGVEADAYDSTRDNAAKISSPGSTFQHPEAPSNAKKDSSSAEMTNESFVDVHVVLPLALTLQQLYGSAAPDGKGRMKSVLGRLLRLAHERLVAAMSTNASKSSSYPDSTCLSETGELSCLLAARTTFWVVLDGEMGFSWLEYLSCVLQRTQVGAHLERTVPDLQRPVLPFRDGECMTAPPNLRFLFETTSLESCSPSVLNLNTLVCFNRADGSDDDMKLVSKEDASEPIHRAYMRRYLAIKRSDWVDSSPYQSLALLTYDVVERRLLQTELLDAIFAAIQEYGCTVELSFLQRAVNLLSVLQALLFSVSAATSNEFASEPQQAGTRADRLVQRVEMALVYAIMWGFAGGVNDNVSLQMLVNGMLKTAFDTVASMWSGCGNDCNLFETLIDIPSMRFMSAHQCVFALSTSLRACELAAPGSGASTAPESFSNASMFVPTHTSVLVHAAMREAVRAGRGVVLAGGDNARRTKLLRSFLRQVECLKSGVQDKEKSSSSSAKPPVVAPAPANTTTEANASTLESVERIRFHQISLVTALAAKFRRLHHVAASTLAERRSAAPVGSETCTAPEADAAARKTCTWTLAPGLLDTTTKFDSGNFVPFFFTMNRFTRGAAELAQCLERMLQRERTGVFEPPPGKLAILIIDDLHLPQDDVSEDESGASCHEYLRSAYEHARVYADDEAATPIRIESLLMVTSTALTPHNSTAASKVKLLRQLFPVVAPCCSAPEIHHIFLTLSLAQFDRPKSSPVERLPQAVRRALSLVVAGSAVLWEKLRQHPWTRNGCAPTPNVPRFRLHDLSRVYEGICSVAPSFILGVDTLMRLWTHESLRSFADPFALTHPSLSQMIATHVWRLRCIMEAMDHRSDGASRSKTSSDPDGTNHLNTGYNALGALSYLSAELQDKPSTTRQPHAMVMESSPMWGFVPSDLYYYQRTATTSTGGTAVANVGTNSAPLTPRSRELRASSRQLQRQRTSSYSFLRRKSMYSMMPAARAWIYAELFAEDASDSEVHVVLQQLFGAIRTHSLSSGSGPHEDAVSALMEQQLPKSAPQVSRELVRVVSFMRGACYCCA